MSLLKNLQSLEKQYAVLEPTQHQRHKLNKKIEDFSDIFLDDIDNIAAFNSDDKVTSLFKLDDQPQNIDEILTIYRKDVIGKGIVASSPGHLGYIPGGGIYASSLADYMAAVSNEYAGIYYASPGAVHIENETIEWLKELF